MTGKNGSAEALVKINVSFIRFNGKFAQVI
jgi:hypothetical protein